MFKKLSDRRKLRNTIDQEDHWNKGVNVHRHVHEVLSTNSQEDDSQLEKIVLDSETLTLDT